MKRLIISAAVLSIFAAGAAHATDVDFDATLTNQCTLALSTPGVMALSADGTVLSSENVGGVAAAITAVSLGANTLTVGAPGVVSSPAEYDATAETVEVAYLGAGGLSAVTQDFTGVQTNVALDVIPQSVLTINARISNPGSFAAGDYTVRTVVTCS